LGIISDSPDIIYALSDSVNFASNKRKHLILRKPHLEALASTRKSTILTGRVQQHTRGAEESKEIEES
jgi:hypothetical protein